MSTAKELNEAVIKINDDGGGAIDITFTAHENRLKNKFLVCTFEKNKSVYLIDRKAIQSD